MIDNKVEGVDIPQSNLTYCIPLARSVTFVVAIYLYLLTLFLHGYTGMELTISPDSQMGWEFTIDRPVVVSSSSSSSSSSLPIPQA